MTRTRMLRGEDWRATTPAACAGALVRLAGTVGGAPAELRLSRDDLATHMLLLGPSGTGKTNALAEVLRQARRAMRPGDTMCVFDPKGDFRGLADPATDVVVPDGPECWNVFGDVVADGWDEEDAAANAREIAQTVFAEAVRGSSSPFFPKAARDLLADVLGAVSLCARDDRDFRARHLNNRALRDFLLGADVSALRGLLGPLPRFSGSLKYLGDGSSEQALGVLAELQEAVAGLLVGGFAGRGAFSSRQFHRHGRGTLFVEYDLTRSATPAYQVIVDSFLKEALAGGRPGSDTYLVIDELPMLPHLLFLENALSFGRSQGVKVIAAAQSVEQLRDAYGDAGAAALVSGFQTLVCFRPSDEATRAVASERCGSALAEVSYLDGDGRARCETRAARVIEDWDLASLGRGEAFVLQPFRSPLRFRFGRYQ